MTSYLFAGFATLFAGLLTAVIFYANGWKTSGEFVGRNFIALSWMVVCVLWLIATWPAHAHDHDHPELDGWYQSLMQPDNPAVPCCGKADAYWCDDYYARGDKAYCKITDDRIVPGRPPIPVGTEVEIPPYKLKFDRANPTGHAVAFITRSLYVLCFVQGSGT